MQITRKEFLQATLAVFGGALGLGAGAGCGGSDEEPSVSCEDGDTDVTISANHGHQLVVSRADVAAGETKTYDIRGSSMHTHSVTISGDRFASLATRGTINLTSDNANQHTHGITVTCA